MIEGRPRVSPRVVASLAELVPARLRRRLDEEPALAEAWTWSSAAERLEIHPSEEVSVRVSAPRGVVESLDQVSCSCLLAPRCLHIAAVLMRLRLADEDDPAATREEEPAAPSVLTLSDGQQAAAQQAWQAGAALIDAGAAGAGLLLNGELLRAVHSCRETGLHRLAAAGLRVAQRLRDLHAERPEFRLGALAGDLADLLATSRHLIGANEVEADWIGTARRAYTPVGSLRVLGLFSEAVVSAAGFAGVVTYVCDQNGRIWSLGDVMPGPPERCMQAYAWPIDLGDASLDHRALGREGLHLQRATGSADGRLGAGRAVAAVRASGCAWTDPPLAGLWRAPLEAQLDRAWAARERGPVGQRAGSDLVFVRGVVRGVRDNTLEVTVGGDLTISCQAATDHAELAYRGNLRLLGHGEGLPLLLIGRVVFGRPRSLVLLAIAPESGGAVYLDVPAAFGGRVNLGLDVLQHAYLRGAAPSPVVLSSVSDGDVADPLAPLRRRIYQVVSGGRSAVSQPAWSGLARDENLLARAQLRTAAQTLRGLRAAVEQVPQPAARRERFARAWLVAWTYTGAATARLQRIGWAESR